MPKKLSNVLTPQTVKYADPGRHADGGGLYLRVKPPVSDKAKAARSWVFRFMLKGVVREVGLGSASGADAISLADARDLRDALRLKVKAGIDPLAERAQAEAEAIAAAQAAKVAAITFKAVAESYIATNEGSWRNDKHRQQWKNTLAAYVYPVVGDLPVSEVATAHVLQILEPIWKDRAETASRVRGRIETILDAAKARGYRDGENPARWRGHIAQILPARSRLSRGHHPALPYERVGEFIADLRTRKATAALALEFTILTAARTGEALSATWSQVDLDKAVWVIPPDKMKAGKEHRVPLSARAVEILRATTLRGSDHLFPSDKGGKLSGMAMAMLVRRMQSASIDKGGKGYLDARQCRVVSPHGFRSSFRDWADERTAYPWEMKEMALAHTIANKAEAAYRRGDLFEKRRRMMDDWAKYCGAIEAKADNITPIRGQA